MALSPDRERILDWMGGVDRALPPTRRHYVVGVPRTVHSFYNQFVIMTADEEVIRFSRPTPAKYPTAKFPRSTDMLRELRDYVLPNDADASYRQYMLSAFPVVKSDQHAWHLAMAQARGVDVPLGVFTSGISEIRHTPRMMLVVGAMVPPQMLLSKLQMMFR